MTLPKIALSKKMVVVVAAMLAVLFRDALELNPDQIEALMVIAGGYAVGQGVADFGKGKAQIENGHKEP